jgi:hypothetical protein
MVITDLIPSADMMIALEPDELGIRLLRLADISQTRKQRHMPS